MGDFGTMEDGKGSARNTIHPNFDLVPRSNTSINPPQRLLGATLSNSMKNQLGVGGFSLVVFSGVVIFFVFVFFFNDPRGVIYGSLHSNDDDDDSVTSLKHLAIGLQASERTYHFRRPYTESWWRPNEFRGYLYLDIPPEGDLLPWSEKSPPYRINDNISDILAEVKPGNPVMPRMVHGIMELFREEEHNPDLRWILMGDDDSVFFVDNLVQVLSKYDHTKYYYMGNPSEFVLSNYWFSFNQAFGGSGIVLSYPLAKALANDMERCLRNYGKLSADTMTMSCIVDLGVNLTPNKGFHQIDLHGDLSGFLSSHPKNLVLSLHHVDTVDPYFPNMNRAESLNHLMKAANVDQSRLFQQTICYDKERNWSFSTAWGYSAQIYEKIMPRSWLMMPIATFVGWNPAETQEPRFMFNVRNPPKDDPCEVPHVFFFESIQKTSDGEILTTYARSAPRNLNACPMGGNHSAEYISKIDVLSPAAKRYEIDRSECCDVVRVDDTGNVKVKFRECRINEVIA
ncbi:OLC1v1007325C1 [Oldenlandia corymbosa var. corymbosa]|uniref:OLC1v1007325C1 n=1 Tax=Oldenlandia corymbosa var. corymbosa TaxID=529605 RepID=A0AAV1DJL8_OLDCO|nr:OLC1v1007325C1 [Oldenlandia corymbosa var. corymbosa]